MTMFLHAFLSFQVFIDSSFDIFVSSKMIDFSVFVGRPLFRFASGDHSSRFDAGSSRRGMCLTSARWCFLIIDEIGGSFPYKFLFDMWMVGGILNMTCNIFVYLPSNDLERDFERAKDSDP